MTADRQIKKAYEHAMNYGKGAHTLIFDEITEFPTTKPSLAEFKLDRALYLELKERLDSTPQGQRVFLTRHEQRALLRLADTNPKSLKDRNRTVARVTVAHYLRKAEEKLAEISAELVSDKIAPQRSKHDDLLDMMSRQLYDIAHTGTKPGQLSPRGRNLTAHTFKFLAWPKLKP